MHEVGIMRELMARIDEAAGDAREITGVAVRIGALSHFTPEHFLEHFEDAARETRAAGAAVHMQLSDDVSDPDALFVRLLSIDVRD